MEKIAVSLVQMPFSAAITPSTALSLLKGELTRRGIASRVEYENLQFLKTVRVDEYILLAESVKNVHMAGERIFAPATHLPYEKTLEQYLSWLEAHFSECLPESSGRAFLEKIPRWAAQSEAFVEAAAARVLARRPRIVACVSSFFQINSVIALCRKVKEMDPTVVTLVGGANCMGTGAIALANAVPWIDFAFSGEADECFADLCALLLERGASAPQEALPYGAVKKGAFAADEANPPCRITRDLDRMAALDFDDYFQTIEALGLQSAVKPGLTVEFSRGCWWGEKHSCSFCGLNGQVNHYRAKSPERILDEIAALADRYREDAFILTDNILSYEHLRELVPRLAAGERRYKFFAELKSNLTPAQLQLLQDAGFCWIQPGIEGLQDDLLALMHKGNRAIRHAALLKQCREKGLYVFWNLLGGFPGEKEAWYEETAQTVSLLTHLQPPVMFRPVAIQRYNEYYKRREAYGLTLEPAEIYRYAYPALPHFVELLAYVFEPADAAARRVGASLRRRGPAYARLQDCVDAWQQSFYENPDRLEMSPGRESLDVLDLRPVAVRAFHRLTGAQRSVYEAAQAPVKVAALPGRLPEYAPREIDAAVEALCAAKLLLRSGGEVLALATRRCAALPTDDFPGRYLTRR